MSLLDIMKQKSQEQDAKRVCVVCGREATGGCGLCYREAMEAYEAECLAAAAELAANPTREPKEPQRPVPVTLCRVDPDPSKGPGNHSCSSQHAREKHGQGLIGETDPQWRGKV